MGPTGAGYASQGAALLHVQITVTMGPLAPLRNAGRTHVPTSPTNSRHKPGKSNLFGFAESRA
jgi:hypothetical protein